MAGDEQWAILRSTKCLDYIKDLQTLCSKLLPHLLNNVPGLDQAAIDLITGDPYRLSPEEVDLANEKLQVACYWSNAIEKLMRSPLGLEALNVTYDQGNVQVHNDPVHIF